MQKSLNSLNPNVLSCMLQQTKHDNLIQGIKACQNAPKINHLMFADDPILYIKVTNSSYQNFNNIFQQFMFGH